MSRIGKKAILVPKSLKVAMQGAEVKVEGPKGKLSYKPNPLMKVEIKDGQIIVSRPSETREAKSLHGLTRTLIANMVHGCEKGFTRELDINGVGYRAEVKGKVLNLTLGYSHPIAYTLPDGVTATVTDEKKTHIILTAADKELLGATAAKVRAFRAVNKDPYGLKGVKYTEEKPLQKEGKSGAK